MDLSQEEKVDFRVNETYAKKYDSWRRKEEIQKYKDRYGESISEDESSSSESEDEVAEALTPRIEKDFLKTLSIIKSKDPKLYQKDIKFFKEDSDQEEGEMQPRGSERIRREKRSEQPMYLKDYERRIIAEREGKFTDDDDDDDDEEEDVERSLSPTYVEEQQRLKESFFSAVHDNSDDEAGDLLTVKKKPQKQEGAMEGRSGKKEESSDSSDMDGLQQFWRDPALDEGEQFLRDFIMNKGYLDKDPTGLKGFKLGDEEEDEDEDDDDDEGGFRRMEEEEEDFSEEERLLEEQEDFERKYNFRFEEPDSEFIKRYPRTVGESVRRKDDKRAKKRVEKKSRQEEEKHKKQQELKQLKNLKRREITERLDKLREVTGNENVGFDIDDLEGDFDPQEHDRLMQKVFSGEYDEQGEDVKPQFDDEEFADENWDDWTRGDEEDAGYHGNEADDGEEEDEYYDDTNFNMDADYMDEAGPAPGEAPGVAPGAGGSRSWQLADEMLGATSKKKRKKLSMFAKALMKKKPVFNPEDKSFEEYIEEYYRLDYEDMIGDLPCRFKYRSVESNDFGLTTEEILRAKEKELNQWASLKKTCQYRSEEEEKKDKEQFRKMGQNAVKKRRIFLSLLEEGDEETAEESPPSGNQPDSGGKQGGKTRKTPRTSPSEVQERVAAGSRDEQHGRTGKTAAGCSGRGPSRTGPRTSDTERIPGAGNAEMGEGMCGMGGEGKGAPPTGGEDRLGPSGDGDAAAPPLSGRDKRRERKKMILAKLKGLRERRKVKRLQGGSKRRVGPTSVSDSRLKAYGFDPKKQRYRMKHALMAKR